MVSMDHSDGLQLLQWQTHVDVENSIETNGYKLIKRKGWRYADNYVQRYRQREFKEHNSDEKKADI